MAFLAPLLASLGSAAAGAGSAIASGAGTALGALEGAGSTALSGLSGLGPVLKPLGQGVEGFVEGRTGLGPGGFGGLASGVTGGSFAPVASTTAERIGSLLSMLGPSGGGGGGAGGANLQALLQLIAEMQSQSPVSGAATRVLPDTSNASAMPTSKPHIGKLIGAVGTILNAGRQG